MRRGSTSPHLEGSGRKGGVEEEWKVERVHDAMWEDRER